MASESSITKAISPFQNTLTTAASLAASAMLARTIVNDLVPYELREYVLSRIEFLRYRCSSSEVTVVVEELDGYNNNLVFEAATTYLSTIISPSIRRVKISQHREDSSLILSLERDEEVVDVYDEVSFKWRMVCQRAQGARDEDGYGPRETRSFELTFLKKHKDKALSDYIPYILKQAKFIKNKDKTLRLFMNDCGCWNPINLHHPATFETLAMDPKAKKEVIDDLTRFTMRKEYYKRIGKAWKRGYLLYGPPGTGKSSLVGAMANFLRFDIYDLELSSVDCNSSLKRMLVNTPSRSILVVEDIDCAIDLQNRDNQSETNNKNEEKITLSGLLNFVDGLWSSSGEERIVVFTTNYKERLDPALLRPGRMDMHIYMGYCNFCMFKTLAYNYHMLHDHHKFGEIESLIDEAEVTPAELAEELMRSDDADVALQGLVELLKGKKEAAAAAAAAEAEVVSKEASDDDDDDDQMPNAEGDGSDNNGEDRLDLKEAKRGKSGQSSRPNKPKARPRRLVATRGRPTRQGLSRS